MQQNAHTPRWATRTRLWITDKSKGTNEILAAAGEPLMRYAAIYLALATGIAAIKWAPLYNVAQGMVIALPEFVLLGALAVAETAITEKHTKGWAMLLYIICAVLALIMVATFVDIFISPFPDACVKGLNFSRCLVAVGFSIVLGKLHADHGEDQAPQSSPAKAPAIDLTPLTEQVTKLADQVAHLQAERQAQDDRENGQLPGNIEAEEQDKNGQEDGQESRKNITLLRPRNQEKDRQKNGQTGPRTKASKAASYIRKNPDISAPDLARKAEIDLSYARKLLREQRAQAVNE